MVLTLSASMLALSYSKESGYNASVPNNAYEDLNVVFSDYEFHSDDDISFTVANNIDKEKEYSIMLELNGALGDVYYILDKGDEKALMGGCRRRSWSSRCGSGCRDGSRPAA